MAAEPPLNTNAVGGAVDDMFSNMTTMASAAQEGTAEQAVASRGPEDSLRDRPQDSPPATAVAAETGGRDPGRAPLEPGRHDDPEGEKAVAASLAEPGTKRERALSTGGSEDVVSPLVSASSSCRSSVGNRASGAGSAAECSEPTSKRQLGISIVEGKHLHGHKQQPVLCAVKIDSYEVARTAALLSSSPFWNITFNFAIPDDFSFVELYAFAGTRDRQTVLGKGVIDKTALVATEGMDTWIELHPVDLEKEITGRLHVDACLRKDSSCEPAQWCLDVTVIDGASFPAGEVYAEVALDEGGTQGNALVTAPSRGPDPAWREQLTFSVKHLIRVSDGELIWRDGSPPAVTVFCWGKSAGGSDKFLGQLSFAVTSRHLQKQHHQLAADQSASEDNSQWYCLAELQSVLGLGEGSAATEASGSIRVRMSYTEEIVLDAQAYAPLQTLVMQTLETGRFYRASPIYHLGRLARNKDSLSIVLVAIFQEKQRLSEFLQLLTDDEISNTADPNTIFRGNSLATKAMDNFMKLVGQTYLHDTLTAVLEEIQTEQRDCEIDPTRQENPSRDGPNNLSNLKYYANRCLIAIVSSAASCPPQMKLAFHNIRNAVKAQFPADDVVGYTAVSGFVFLRFFAAAILSPWLFGLARTQPSDGVRRTLTLLSKTVQNLGNLSGDRGVKEPFMKDINEQVVDKNRGRVMQFLDTISAAPADCGPQVPAAATLAPGGRRVMVHLEGYLTKRGQGRFKSVMGMNVRGRKNFKRRYFVLDTDGLTYHKDKGEDAIYRIRRESIVGVEAVAPDTFEMPHMIQVIQREKTLYVSADSESDASNWLCELRRFVHGQRGMRTMYHPGAHLGGVWSCCGHKSPKRPVGCTPVSSGPAVRYPSLNKTDVSRPVAPPDISQLSERLYRVFASTPMDDLREGNAEHAKLCSQQTPEFMEVLDTGRQALNDACAVIAEKHSDLGKHASREGSKYTPLRAKPSLHRDPRRGTRSPKAPRAPKK